MSGAQVTPKKRLRQAAKLAGASRKLAALRNYPITAHLSRITISEVIKTIDDIELDLRSEADGEGRE